MNLGLDRVLWPTKGKIDKFDVIKIKNFYSENDPVKRIKKQAPNKEKIFASHIADKGIELIYRTVKDQAIQVENRQNPWAKI